MPRFKFRQHDDCVVGAIDIEIPGGPGHMRIAAVGDDKADALGRAALIAERIASDPIMKALMPPQAAAAIAAAKGLAAASKRGSQVVRHFWRKLKGPGKKRLASVLHAEAVDREKESGEHVAAWPFEHHVRDLRRPQSGSADVGWSPFRKPRNPFRRKKRKVPKMRRPQPRREREEPDEREQGDDAQQDSPEQEQQHTPSQPMPPSYDEQFAQAEGDNSEEE